MPKAEAFVQVPVALVMAGKPGMVEVYAAIGSHARGGKCWPSTARIAEACGITDRTVVPRIEWLHAHGWITMERRTGQSTLYTLHAAPVRTPEESSPPTPEDISEVPPKILQPTPEDISPEVDTEKKKQILPPSGPPAKKPRKTGNAQPKRKRRWTIAPEGWEPSAHHRELAAEHGVDLDLEAAKFRDHEYTTPKSDPDRTFNNWIRNAAEFAAKARGNRPPAGSQAAQVSEARSYHDRPRPTTASQPSRPGDDPEAERRREQADNDRALRWIKDNPEASDAMLADIRDEMGDTYRGLAGAGRVVEEARLRARVLDEVLRPKPMEKVG